ncbi:hypothetical protein B0H13DRAFT_2453955 [Mycena leptocephala]|nr:hypothetical protein B0H13DRAFT_2453955 [Mycena leptocephala]
MIRRSARAPLRLSSPALIIGARLEDSGGESYDLTADEVENLAHITQPHLEALLVAQHQCYSHSISPVTAPESSPYRPCIFAIAFRDMTLFIVAHIPYLHETTYRYRSLVVDKIPFPLYVPGDEDGVIERLRIIIALLTIRNHTDRMAALWNDVIWPPSVIDVEQTLVRERTGIATRSPSEYTDLDGLMWGNMFDYIGIASGDAELAIDPPPSEIARSKEMVDAWLAELAEPDNMQDSDSVVLEPL